MLRSPSLLALAGILVFLSACRDKDDAPPLEGERISVLELQRSLEPDDPLLEAQGLQMPPVWQNEFWPQVGGYPNHSMQNLALNGGELKQAWSVDIGEGGDEEIPLITQPIIFDGVIYALGRPRPRRAMMSLCISEVPAAIVEDTELRERRCMYPCKGAHFDPLDSWPVIPRMSIPVLATLWVSSVPKSLDIDASALGTMSWLCIQATW